MVTPESKSPTSFLPGVHRFSQLERVRWGASLADSLFDEMELLGSERVFVMTNRSLSVSPILASVIQVLGPRFAGSYDQITAHSPRDCVIAGAGAARSADADKLLAIGGGSVIDATKGMLLCLRHGFTSIDQLDLHAGVRPIDSGVTPADSSEWLRMIALPTTLSGAEFAPAAGISDPVKGIKQAFVNPMQIPQSVILDPALTLSTPMPLLKSTGLKAVDHAVERITAKTANPYSDAVSELALRLLIDALPALDTQPDDLELRSRLQYAVFMSVCGAASGVSGNVSHSIGHVLGAHAGVPHGLTTGVTLPAVLRWLAPDTTEPQQRLATLFGVSAPSPDAASGVLSLAASLGLPTRLRDVGVAPGDFSVIAAKTMHEALLKNSARAVQGPSDIVEILESAW